MPFIPHLTKPGDRWDLLAYKYYGDASQTGEIYAANPDVALDKILPQGLTILIPILDDVQVDTSLIPPWER